MDLHVKIYYFSSKSILYCWPICIYRRNIYIIFASILVIVEGKLVMIYTNVSRKREQIGLLLAQGDAAVYPYPPMNVSQDIRLEQYGS